MVNILGEDYVDPAVLNIPSCHLHWYGKSKRLGRKMGHINVCGQDNAQLAERFLALAALLPTDKFLDVADVAKLFAARHQQN
jgi:5-(carboxyamino)imidazole ribonucleotide synthase